MTGKRTCCSKLKSWKDINSKEKLFKGERKSKNEKWKAISKAEGDS